MLILILGLALFLGTHSIRIGADDWRTRQIGRIGEMRWKGMYAIASIAGFALIVWGYGLARLEPVYIWFPPVWTKHLAALLTLPAFILLVAAYVPGTRIRASIGHPMLAGTKLWAFAHLVANGTLADVLLFGSFLIWAVCAFVASRQRDRNSGIVRKAGSLRHDAVALAIGIVAWFVFVRYAHAWLFGVAPFG
jgi:uncharacterized membrane protein